MRTRSAVLEHAGRGIAALVLAPCLLIAGCQSIDGPSPVLIPNEELVVSRSVSIPADVIALAVGTYLVVDPLAPNWRIEQSDLGGNRYAFALKRKRFTSGGDGEAAQVFQRRVEQLAREQGYSGYEILAFTEGVDSSLPIVAQRVSQGIVQFARAR